MKSEINFVNWEHSKFRVAVFVCLFLFCFFKPNWCTRKCILKCLFVPGWNVQGQQVLGVQSRTGAGAGDTEVAAACSGQSHQAPLLGRLWPCSPALPLGAAWLGGAVVLPGLWQNALPVLCTFVFSMTLRSKWMAEKWMRSEKGVKLPCRMCNLPLFASSPTYSVLGVCWTSFHVCWSDVCGVYWNSKEELLCK